MTKKNHQKKTRRRNLTGDEGIIDRLERMSVGILYASTKLAQNEIAQVMGMGDARVNEILRGLKKQDNK